VRKKLKNLAAITHCCFNSKVNTHSYKQRILKVELSGDRFKNGTFPKIRLEGKWLAASGFHPNGVAIITQTGPGELLLHFTTLSLSNRQTTKPRLKI
jgi:hypothetical protein